MPWRYAAASVNESHLVDFAQCRGTDPHLRQPAFAQSNHTFFARDPFDFRGRTPVDNHLADPIGKIKQLANRGSPVVSGAGTLQATRPFANVCVFEILLLQSRL